MVIKTAEFLTAGAHRLLPSSVPTPLLFPTSFTLLECVRHRSAFSGDEKGTGSHEEKIEGCLSSPAMALLSGYSPDLRSLIWLTFQYTLIPSSAFNFRFVYFCFFASDSTTVFGTILLREGDRKQELEALQRWEVLLEFNDILSLQNLWKSFFLKKSEVKAHMTSSGSENNERKRNETKTESSAKNSATYPWEKQRPTTDSGPCPNIDGRFYYNE
ncbi:hypothetical protein M9H77_18528 [Catharanthus roseus]|uniref:Uncharacterized protein n=1 Tax=Catharanthus roseus TaxID=4058 RepID=A0ACC0B7Q5_CATRO|nr:hypothetical protein M9H77_18528 [Catharanthus roseus]